MQELFCVALPKDGQPVLEEYASDFTGTIRANSGIDPNARRVMMALGNELVDARNRVIGRLDDWLQNHMAERVEFWTANRSMADLLHQGMCLARSGDHITALLFSRRPAIAAQA